MFNLISSLLTLLIINIAIHTTELKNKTLMNIYPATLWQLIDELDGQPDFTLDAIKKLFMVDFLKRGDNGYTMFYEGGPLHLTDQVAIEMIDFRIRRKDEVSRLMVLNLDADGACVTHEQMRMHYPDVVITGTPRGDSIDDETYWSIQRPWGRLSFGFKERKPRCLTSIVFNRTSPIPASTEQG